MKKIIYIISVFIFAGSFILNLSQYYVNKSDLLLKDKVYEVVIAVEKFRVRNGKLPASLKDIGFDYEMNGPIYYSILKDNVEYSVTYSVDFDENPGYYSYLSGWRNY